MYEYVSLIGIPGTTYECFGAVYKADGNGVMGIVASGDVKELLQLGCVFGITSTNTVTIEAGSFYDCTLLDGLIYVNKSVGSTTEIFLFPSPNITSFVKVKDAKGDCATNPITISGNGNNIDGQSSFVMNQNYSAYEFKWNGSQWSVF